MVIRVVEFSKLERSLPKNLHAQRKSLNCENWFKTKKHQQKVALALLAESKGYQNSKGILDRKTNINCP